MGGGASRAELPRRREIAGASAQAGPQGATGPPGQPAADAHRGGLLPGIPPAAAIGQRVARLFPRSVAEAKASQASPGERAFSGIGVAHPEAARRGLPAYG